MKTRKSLGRFTAAMGAVAVLAMTGSGAGDAHSQETQEWKLRLQSFSARGEDAQWVSPQKLVDFIREETGGAVDITVYPATQLVPTREIYSAVAQGVIDAGTVTGDYISGQHPEANWGMLPVAPSRDAWFEVMDGGVRDYIAEQLREDGIEILSFYPLNDMTVYALTDQPLRTLEDFQGKRIRGFGGVNDEFMAKQGAGVSVMSMGDAYTAVQTGVLDGVSTALAGYHTMQGWEIAPYITWAKGLGVAVHQLVIINAEVWNSFPAEIQEAIRRAESRHREWDAQYIEAWKEEAVARFTENGATVTILEPEEAAAWRAAFMEVGLPWYVDTGGENARHVLGMAEQILDQEILP